MARCRNDAGFIADLGYQVAIAIFFIGIAVSVIASSWRDGSSALSANLPTVISTQQLAGKTIRDDASKRCFTVVQQDGAPRLVPADCPKK